MSDNSENTFTSYLGPEFQQKLMWQILVEPEFAEKAIPELAVEYFDDPNFKRLFLIILEYIREYGKVPNLQNHSITQAIYQFRTPNNPIEEESLNSVIKRIELWNERVLNKQLTHDGDVIQESTHAFIKQQEYRKLAENISTKVKTGEIRNKKEIGGIEDRFQKIAHIGADENYGTEIFEGVEKALRPEFRQTIPTGVVTLDALTGGGLGKGEIGLILSPSGVGKSTLLTKIANTARDLDYNVLQIIFEDTEDQIKRKHYSIWTGTALSAIDANRDAVTQKVNDKIQKLGNKGKLVIRRFSQEDTTMRDIRAWIVDYQKRFGIKFDIVILDYLDCLDSHKKTPDRNEAELVIVKSFEAMASDFDIPCWSAIQSNRAGFDSEIVEASQSGGSIKRLQKAHLFMSIAKTPDQKEASLATIKIIKARFAQDGQIFRDCIFNNDTMEIVIRDSGFVGGSYVNKKKYGDLVAAQYGTAPSIHGVISSVLPETEEDADIDKLRNAYIENFNIEEKKTEITAVKDNAETDNTVITRYFNDPNIVNNNTEIVNNTGTDINHPNNKYVTETTVSEAIDNGLFEIEDKPIEKNAVNISIGVDVGHINDPASKTIFEWTGETYTTATNDVEVKYEDIQPEPPMIVRYFDTTPPVVPVQPQVSVVEIVPLVTMTTKDIIENNVVKPHIPLQIINTKPANFAELEKKLLDEDDVPSHNRGVFDMLRNMSKSQSVVKRE